MINSTWHIVQGNEITEISLFNHQAIPDMDRPQAAMMKSRKCPRLEKNMVEITLV